MGFMLVEQARQELIGALRQVEGLHVSGDPGQVGVPPVALVGIPAVGWRAYDRQPTDARFVVALVVPADDRATERLCRLLPLVVDAVEAAGVATVQDGAAAAVPGVWNIGGADLPAWEVTFNVEL